MKIKPVVSFPIACLYVQLFGVSNGTLLGEQNIQFSKQLDGVPLRTSVGINLDACRKECEARKGCSSINYNPMSFICELNSGERNDEDYSEPQISKGWVYLKMSLKTDCDCNEGEVCRMNGSLGICVVEECLMASQITNGRLYGNMNDVGSKVSYECDTGYIMYGPSVSICGPTGQWSTLPRCIYEEPCQNPFNVNGIQILNGTIVHGLNVVYFYSTVLSTMRSSATTFLEGSAISLQCAGDVHQNLHAACSLGIWQYYTYTNCSDSSSPACSASTICGTLQNISCTNVICACPPGSRFSYTTHECLSDCPNGYANTFTKVPKTGMFNSNNVRELSVDLFTCENACLNYSDSECVRYEYGLDILGVMCYLWDTNLQDYEDDVGEWSTGDTYIRDCL